MGQAVVGLIGVVVGGLLSGGVTYVMARRADARRARGAARMLEAELRPVSVQLGAVGEVLGADLLQSGGAVNIATLPDAPEPRLWQEHQALLAEVLDSDDWYALAEAYDCVAALRDIVAAKDVIMRGDRERRLWLAGIAMGLKEVVDVGVAALSGLAGGAKTSYAEPIRLTVERAIMWGRHPRWPEPDQGVVAVDREDAAPSAPTSATATRDRELGGP